jgi:UDP-N-acetylglucosamine 2-epimerase (non-hydrolysing)
MKQILIHTGQHYSPNMSDIFFAQLGLPAPDYFLGVGSGTHATQTAQVMIHCDRILSEVRPDRVLVYGDVNSTLGAALVCSKLGIPVAHVEAGCRSFDRTMPEELNRVLVDQMSDLLFTPAAECAENLAREGISGSHVQFVGNVMIDTLIRLLPFATHSPSISLPPKYALVTLHRPSNVDNVEVLERLMAVLRHVSSRLPVIFPIHPRTRSRVTQLGLVRLPDTRFSMIEPLGYLEFLALERDAAVVVTDSGGVQEETTYLNVPCLTMRANTERPITVTIGTNTLIGGDPSQLEAEIERVLQGRAKLGKCPPLWDGDSSVRIARRLAAEAAL